MSVSDAMNLSTGCFVGTRYWVICMAIVAGDCIAKLAQIPSAEVLRPALDVRSIALVQHDRPVQSMNPRVEYGINLLASLSDVNFAFDAVNVNPWHVATARRIAVTGMWQHLVELPSPGVARETGDDFFDGLRA